MKKIVFDAVLLSMAVAVVVLFSARLASAEVKKIPQRSEIDSKYKWNLEDIYADTASWQADFDKLQSQMRGLEKYKGKLGESADNLYECLSLQDSLNIILGRLYVYAFMKQDEDTRVSDYQQLGGKIAALNAQFGSIVSFVNPEILEMPNDKLIGFVNSNEKLEPYRFYIEDLIRSKEHILSPEEERILALAGNATDAPRNIFRMMYNADVKFPVITDENGEEIQLTRERFSEIMKSPNRDVRRKAHQKYNEAYNNYFNSFGAILASTVNKNLFYAQARNYDSSVEMSLNGDNIPVSVLTSLIDAVNSNLAPLHKWMSLRKRIMGLDELHAYDTSVPLVPEAKEEITYDEAQKILAKGLKPLGKDYIKKLKMGLSSGWVDVYETEGKRSGGYQWGSYSTHPYILMNYNDNIESMFTLAHEMGHGLHSYNSRKSQSYRNAGYATFVAEVASTTNEAILIKYMLDHTKDKRKKMYLLNYYIEQIIGTFYFQTLLSEFEMSIYDVVENGGALSSESMKKIYSDLVQKYWGPDYIIDEWSGWGGIRIPHFTTNRSFYVFQYATSYAAAQAISKKIIDGDKKTRDRYLEFLSSGGSDYPVQLLKNVGVDMTTPQPVNDAIAVFSDLVDQMEKLLDEN